MKHYNKHSWGNDTRYKKSKISVYHKDTTSGKPPKQWPECRISTYKNTQTEIFSIQETITINVSWII